VLGRVTLSSGEGPGDVEVVTSPDKHNSCSNPLPDRARVGWEHCPVLTSPIRCDPGEAALCLCVSPPDVSVQPDTCPWSCDSHSDGRVWDWACSPQIGGMDKEHPVLPTVTRRPLSADARVVGASDLWDAWAERYVQILCSQPQPLAAAETKGRTPRVCMKLPLQHAPLSPAKSGH